MIYINLFFLSVIVCYIVDISGIVSTIKRWIWFFAYGNKQVYREYEIKPFDCSLCMVFWVGIIYILFTQWSIFNLMVVCLLSLMSESITNLLRLGKIVIDRIEDKILNKLE